MRTFHARRTKFTTRAVYRMLSLWEKITGVSSWWWPSPNGCDMPNCDGFNILVVLAVKRVDYSLNGILESEFHVFYSIPSRQKHRKGWGETRFTDFFFFFFLQPGFVLTFNLKAVSEVVILTIVFRNHTAHPITVVRTLPLYYYVQSGLLCPHYGVTLPTRQRQHISS